MNWIYLVVTGLLEIAWAVGLKYTDGWTKLWPSIIIDVCIFLIITGIGGLLH